MHTANVTSFRQVAENTLITIENDSATAEISLFGGHVLSFIPKQDGRDRLWMSSLTKTDGSEAIRGGVPVCWPWFSDQFPESSDILPKHGRPNHELPNHELPNHGYARTSMWQLTCIETPDTATTIVTLEFALEGVAGFPYKALLQYRIEIGKELDLQLLIKNTGDSDLAFTGALHTYFSVNNISDIEILGLEGKYKDKTHNFQEFDTPAHYKIHGETDRIHLTDASSVSIRELQQNTFIDINSVRFAITLVPNEVRTEF